MIKSGSRILFYLPYSGIAERAQLEFSLIRELSIQGIQVDTLRCRGGLPGVCAVKRSTNGEVQPLNKILESIICKNCHKSGHRIAGLSGVTQIYIEEVLENQTLSELRDLSSQVTPTSWSTFMFNELPIGRYAAYVPLIRANAASPIDIDSDWDRYRSELLASLMVAESTSRLLKDKKYDVAIAFGGLYGPDKTFIRTAEHQGIPVVVLEGSALAQEQNSVLHAYYSVEKYFHVVLSAEWDLAKTLPLTVPAAVRAAKHHESLTDSSSPLVYSSRRNRNLSTEDVLAFFNLPSTAKIIVFTVSSPDEEVAREFSADVHPPLSEDSASLQRRYIEQLKQYVQANPDVYLVVRLHPRLFAAGQRRTNSPSLDYYSRLASENQQNVRVNTPDQNISFYDLIQIADVGVTHISSTAIEFLALGIPVVVGGQTFLTCPSDLVRVPSEKKDLSEHLTEALEEEPSISKATSALRWWGFVSRFNRLLQLSPVQSQTEVYTLSSQDISASGSASFSQLLNAWNFTSTFKRYIPHKLVVLLYVFSVKYRLKAKPRSTNNIIEIFNVLLQRQDHIASEPVLTLDDEKRFVREHLLRIFRSLNFEPTSGTKMGTMYHRLKATTNIDTDSY